MNLSPAPAAVVAVDVAVDVAVAIAAFIDQAITIWQLEIGILCSPVWAVGRPPFCGCVYPLIFECRLLRDLLILSVIEPTTQVGPNQRSVFWPKYLKFPSTWDETKN